MSSRNDIPKAWGRNAWIFMHTWTWAFPEEPTLSQQKAAIAFFNSLAVIMPCPRCRKHFSDLIRDSPVERVAYSGKALREWLVDVHNDVNVSLGRKPVSYEEAAKIWNAKNKANNGNKAGDGMSTSSKIMIFFVIIVTLVILFLLSMSIRRVFFFR